MRKIYTKLIIFMLMTTLLLPVAVVAQLDSLAVWENIAGGTLTSTWTEVADNEWKGQNDSGDYVYNSSTDNYAWTYNNTVSGSRWYQTYEVQIGTSDDGTGCIQTRNSSDFYGIVYYLDNTNHPMGDGTPDAYLVYNDGGTMYFWNSTGYETNVSNATDLLNDYEADCMSDYCRVKALWNWEIDDGTSNCSVRFKIWNPSGTEPTIWHVDENFTYYEGAEYTEWKSGLFTDCSYGVSSEVDYRRIFFWNLSYDLYSTSPPISQIICPTYDAMDFYNYLLTLDDTLWNNTQALKTWINTWDLTSYYDNDFYDNNDYNDTTYIFTNMLVDFVDFWETLYPNTPLPEEAPDNTLVFNIYEPMDGRDNASDYCLIRIDSDNNNVYNDHDYAFQIFANGTDRFYQGWTGLSNGDEWYGVLSENWAGANETGWMFADHGYHIWAGYINWDLLYNGTSNERIGSDICRISIAFYNANDSWMSIWQDWDMTEDTIPYPSSEEHNASLTPTWEAQNDTSVWGYFWVDETLGEGDPMADPEDQDSIYDNMDETTRNLLQDVLPILLAVLIFSVIVGLIFTQGITKETLIGIMILTILGIVIIQVILGL